MSKNANRQYLLKKKEFCSRLGPHDNLGKFGPTLIPFEIPAHFDVLRSHRGGIETIWQSPRILSDRAITRS